MAGSGKKKTTMAKLNREHRVRERRMEKKLKKDARKLEPSQPLGEVSDISMDDALEPELNLDGEPGTMEPEPMPAPHGRGLRSA